MVAEQVEVKRLIFVDEMGTNTALSPLYAWAPKGQRTYWSVPRNRGANTTVLSSMSLRGMGPSLTVEGATTSVVFEAYVEQVLAPTLRRGQVVVMDNLSARLLVGSAHYILGPFAQDCDLRRHGLKIAGHTAAKNARKRAVVAVARKLSVLLHHLWISGEVYEPLYKARRQPKDRAA